MLDPARSTAVITGASSGIGIHFAKELAQRGFDLVLAARRMDRLETVKSQLEAEFNVDVDVIGCDLNSSEGARQLWTDVQALDKNVTTLINNAGHGKFGPTLEQSLEDIQSMIDVNVSALTILTRLFAADFAERGGGYILNHASYSAIQPTPSYAVYSGTKAFVLAFSQALHHEVKQHGVHVTALCPGFFATEFLAKAEQRPSMMVRMALLRPEDVARAGIRGLLRGKAIIIPGIRYKMLNLLIRCLPRRSASALADFAVKT